MLNLKNPRLYIPVIFLASTLPFLTREQSMQEQFQHYRVPQNAPIQEQPQQDTIREQITPKKSEPDALEKLQRNYRKNPYKEKTIFA